MNRHEFLALIVASPLALLIGKWKQDEQYNIYCDTLPEWQPNHSGDSELLTVERMHELYRRMSAREYYIKKQLAFMRGEQWNKEVANG